MRKAIRDGVWAAVALLLVLLGAMMAGCAAGVPAHSNPVKVLHYILGIFAGVVVLYHIVEIIRAMPKARRFWAAQRARAQHTAGASSG